MRTISALTSSQSACPGNNTDRVPTTWPASVTRFRPVVDEPVSLLDLVPTLVDGLALDGADEPALVGKVSELFTGKGIVPPPLSAEEA